MGPSPRARWAQRLPGEFRRPFHVELNVFIARHFHIDLDELAIPTGQFGARNEHAELPRCVPRVSTSGTSSTSSTVEEQPMPLQCCSAPVRHLPSSTGSAVRRRTSPRPKDRLSGPQPPRRPSTNHNEHGARCGTPREPNRSIKPSTCRVRNADDVQRRGHRGPAAARDVLCQRNQAPEVMSTMSTLSC